MTTKADLRAWMRIHSYSAPQAAAHLKVTGRTVYRWLQGKRKIPAWLEFAIKK